MKNLYSKSWMLLSGILIYTLFSTSAFAISSAAQAEIMIFVGEGCPHCTNVEQYVDENNIMSKLPIKYYEVWYNAENQELYLQKAKEVGYTQTGVPLLIDGNHFESGDGPIITYLGNLLNNQTQEAVKAIEKAAKPVEPKQAQAELQPVQPEIIPQTKLSNDDSAELKDIAKGEASIKDLGKSPYVYVAGGIIFLGVVASLYVMRKKRRS
ncbi:MAG: hypothetical protein WC285_04885 [Candidatus Gracilibacteria bacterium]|jgi:glutaredoxin